MEYMERTEGIAQPSILKARNVLQNSKTNDWIEEMDSHDMDERMKACDVMWSEKKLNLDNHDRLASYWHDLHKEDLVFSNHVQGCGNVVWFGQLWAHLEKHWVFISYEM